MTRDKNPQNCKKSFCLGSFLTTRSRRCVDHKDRLSEIPFSSPETQTTSHEVQTDWLALSQTVSTNKVLYTRLKTVYDSRSHQNLDYTRLINGFLRNGSPRSL